MTIIMDMAAERNDDPSGPTPRTVKLLLPSQF